MSARWRRPRRRNTAIAIPDIAGIIAVLAGGFLVFMGRRRA